MCDVALENDVVTISPGSGFGQDSAEFCTGRTAFVEIVGSHRVVFPIEFDGSSESNFIGIHAEAALTGGIGWVVIDEGCRAGASWFVLLTAIENQILDILSTQTFRTTWPQY